MELEIRIGNAYLDIDRDASFSFVRTNAIFDFDNLTYTRSTSFSIPRTNKNEVTLTHAGNIHATGAYMRKKIECYTVIEGVPSIGYLYITSANMDKYNCNLYIGEYVGDIFGRKLSEFLTDDERATKLVYGDEALVKDVQETNDKIVAVTRYYQELEPDENGYKSITDIHTMPSWSIDLLLKRIFGQDFNCGARIITDGSKEAVCVRNDITLTFGSNGDVTISGDEDGEFKVGRQPEETLQRVSVNETTGRQTETKKRVYKVVCNHDVYIAGYAERMIYIGDYHISGVSVWNNDGKYFIASVGTTDPVLASKYAVVSDSVEIEEDVVKYAYFRGNGQTNEPVIIPANTPFRVASPEQHTPNEPSRQYPTTEVNLLNGTATGITIYAKYKIVTAEDVAPSMSVADLLRLYARLKGILLYWNGKQVVEVQSYTDDGELHDVISSSGVRRVFSNFAQRTYIAYSDDENRRYTDAVYTVNNETLTAETIKTLPVGGGGENVNRPTATIAVLEQRYPMVGAEGDEMYMLRKNIPNNTAVDNLCSTSTQIKVKYRTSYKAFMEMRYNDMLTYDNAKWVWLTSTWQDGIAEITLQRV